MNNIAITYETPTLLVISLVDLLANNNKAFADITDAVYLLKSAPEDTDAAALLSKDFKTTNGITIDTPGALINIMIDKTDFGTGKLEVGRYLVCFAVEFEDNGIYIEDDDLQKNNYLVITTDKIRK